MNTINNSAKLRTYKCFKTVFGTEKYVILNITKRERSTLAQFRSGILPLRIETGRYVNETLDDQLCGFCNNGYIESETYFLLECDRFKLIREQIFVDILNALLFIQKFAVLLLLLPNIVQGPLWGIHTQVKTVNVVVLTEICELIIS